MRKKKKTNSYKQFIVVLPVLIGIANIISIIKINLLFKYFFHINIVHYIDLSELIELLLEDVEALMVLAVITILFILLNIRFKITSFLSEQLKENSGRLYFISLITIATPMFFIFIIIKQPYYWLLSIFTILITILIFIPIKAYINKNIGLITSIMAGAFIFSYGLFWHELKNITYKREYISSFKYNGRTIEMTPKSKVIGCTKKYYFLYNDSNATTTILERNKIDSVVVDFK